ncbi:hypothetical protein ACFV42_23595 [Streptomyces solisilvae]|uniref:hypothetical protein n=1 Tax=Streptomyces malaysiensis TaxID=92644 RepID=UPI00368F83FF
MSHDRSAYDIALNDQIRAAASEISQALHATGHEGIDLPIGPGQSLPPWMTKVLMAQHRADRAGHLRCCPHFTGPAPAVVFAEQPDRLRCPACAEEDKILRLCAGCEVPSSANTEVMMVQYAMLVYSFHWCPECQRTNAARATFGVGPKI